MGYNSAIVIMNDCLHEIENDPHFGKAVASAVAEHWGVNRTGRTYTPFTHNSMVIAQHHSSTVSINLVGGNMGLMIGHSRRTDGRYCEPDQKILVLKELAESLGYKLIKMSERELKNKPWANQPFNGGSCLM